jgi:ureidoglycolate dehydrogenase (NAD+)
VIVSAGELKTLVASIYRGRGLSERDSGIMADSLVHANLRGTDSHGVLRVPHYISRVDAGSVNPRPNTKVERTSAATAMMDGDHGFGHVSTWDAMEVAMNIARESGVGFVGINHSNHCGALSFPGHRAAEAGFIGIVFTQTDKGMVPFGGKLAFFGTNPLCFAIPAAPSPPVILDMATSTVAFGHIYKARIENKPIPPTWALDIEGKPTTDPHKAVYSTPAAGAKGFGLSMIVDVLTGVLCGGAFGPHIQIMYGELEKPRNLCHLVAALDTQRFGGGGAFLKQMTAMISELHEAPPAEGFDRVMAPGEPEHLRSLERAKDGIPLPEQVWNDLNALLAGPPKK